MRILFDLTYVAPNSVSGVTNYAYRLLRGLKEYSTNYHIILLVTNENLNTIKYNICDYELVVIQLRTYNKLPCFDGLLNKKRLEKIINELNIDLFVSPYISSCSLYTTQIPSLGVFHDAQGLKLNRNPIKQFVYNIFIKHILKKQTNVVTISNFAKKDILKYFPALRCKINVIYNSIQPLVYYSCKKNKTDPYILNVNTLESYKNLITLVKAMDLLQEKIPHLLYVKAKRLPYWDNVILPYISGHNLLNRVKLIEEKYSEEEMAFLYRNADLFVSPSLMEGFGYTPIEAAVYGTPVICSKESALYETTRGLLNYYSPATDEKELAACILRQITNPMDEKILFSISNNYINYYSPKNQAKQFIELFNRLI